MLHAYNSCADPGGHLPLNSNTKQLETELVAVEQWLEASRVSWTESGRH